MKASLMTILGFFVIIFFFIFFIFLMSCLTPNSDFEALCVPFNPIIQFIHSLVGG